MLRVPTTNFARAQIDLRYAGDNEGELSVVVAPVLRFLDIGFNANIKIEVRVALSRVRARGIWGDQPRAAIMAMRRDCSRLPSPLRPMRPGANIAHIRSTNAAQWHANIQRIRCTLRIDLQWDVCCRLLA